MLVGEAPGKTETILHRPFVGKSGELLNRVLQAADVLREDLYITNTTICRPDNNDTPSQAAIKACRARLYEEVRLRRPRLVIVMGATALKAFGIDDKISQCRGRERWISAEHLQTTLLKGVPKKDQQVPIGMGDWRDGGFYILPTYHPAYVLRNPDLMPDLERDFARAMSLLQKDAGERRELPPVDAIVPRTIHECLRWLDVVAQQPIIACDIESTSKDVMQDRLLTLAYAWHSGQDSTTALVIPAAMAANGLVRRRLRELHRAPTPRCVWWNGKFDRKWYRHHLDVDVRIDGDGMLAHFALDSRPNIHGLKIRASDDLNAEDYEEEIKQYIVGSIVDYSNIPFEKLVEYTATDVGMTLLLVEQYEAALKEQPGPQWVYQHILLPAAMALSDIELAGAAVDVGRLTALEAEFQTMLAGYQRQFWDAVGCEFNVGSYPQVVQVMYGDAVRQQFPSADKASAAGLPSLNLPLQLNEKKTPNTGSGACDKLLQLALAPNQRQGVEARRRLVLDGQLYRTYVRKLPQVVHLDQRVRTNFNLHVVRTGRLSSSQPINLQNIPTRTKIGQRIKAAFVAGEYLGQPTVLVEVDASQAELRVAAFKSQDPALLAIYEQGRDFHHEVGTRILGSEDLAKALRPYVKTFLFATLYGADTPMLVLLLNDAAIEEETRTGKPQERWTLDRVEALRNEFWTQFPVFATWAEQQQIQALTEGYVTNHFGRVRRFPLITKGPDGNVRDVLKEAVNMPIQGDASDIVLLALIETHRWLQANRLGRIILSVHDSILMEVLTAHAQTVAQRVVAIMEAVPARYGITIPFKAEAKAGPDWAHLEPLTLNHAQQEAA